MEGVKIFAIPLIGNSSKYSVSKLFARSPYFLIYDEKDGRKEIVNNSFKDEQQKSGKFLSKNLVAKGVNVFLGIDIGFNVQKIAEENNIQLILLPEKKEIIVDTIINMIKNK